MDVRCALVVALLSAGAFAQSAPSSCPADRPVDDIIAEVNKQQSKMKNRNSNPFASVTCIWGWCRDVARTPPTIPENAPEAEIPANDSGVSSSSSNSSSNKTPTSKCLEATEAALEAAHNVDVGDYYFDGKNYKAALLRYKDACEGKADDAAIHVRLGRVLEKLEQFSGAVVEYKAAQKLPGPKKWVDEAGDSLARLQASRAR